MIFVGHSWSLMHKQISVDQTFARPLGVPIKTRPDKDVFFYHFSQVDKKVKTLK